MNNVPSAEIILELLENLRSTVSHFFEREEKLNSQLRAKITAEKSRRDKAIEENKSAVAAAIIEENAKFQTAKGAAEARFKKRKSRLIHAHRMSTKGGLQKIEDKEGKRKNKLQMETLQANRIREAALATAEKVNLEFTNRLIAEQGFTTQVEEAARTAFSGYGSFCAMISASAVLDEAAVNRDENELLAESQQLLGQANEAARRFGRMPLPFIFRLRLPCLFLISLLFPLVPLLHLYGKAEFTFQKAGMVAGGLLVAGFILHQLSRRSLTPLAASIASGIVRARKLHEICGEKSATRFQQETERAEQDYRTKTEAINQRWSDTLDEATGGRESLPAKIETKAARANAKNESLFRKRIEGIEKEYAAVISRLKNESESKQKEFAELCDSKEKTYTADFNACWKALETEWNNAIRPLFESISAADVAARKISPEWQPELWKTWTAPQKFAHAARLGGIEVELEKLAEVVGKGSRLTFPAVPKFSLPLALTYPDHGSLVIETNHVGRDEAVGALNNIILRLLSNAPPGRLAFTVFDPVGLGQNFSGVMHLADIAEHVINSRIWTQPSQIEQQLADLNEHMEKVIQMYLRNEYATIAEYNEQAGNIAEKYHFLVVADFPANFTEQAAKRLLSIATSGARCGVFTLIHWNQSHLLPADFAAEELRRSSVCISHKGKQFTFAGKNIPGTNLLLDAPPSPELAIDLVQKIGQASRDSNRVEVPFSHVAPPDSELWKLETTSELRVPIGRTGATKLQYLEIGKGTRQHALLAGKTGSGKSTLFHVIITNLALWCSPEQVEFYLIDFKKGVEFKCYAERKLPHARVIAIESDREFGLSVLQRLDDELRRRGDLFRKLGVQDLAGYKRAGGSEPIPRTLLMIDEFQEFFVEDDKISQGASVLLDRIVRQGRAFGIHVLLGSQTLGGAYTMARTTMGQMVIRIALQCNEADAYLIMDENNPAPRLLSRPGEGIYNDEAGAMQGNSPFQTVWLPDEVRDSYLEKVLEQAAKNKSPFAAPVVFEGNVPADIRENTELQKLLAAPAKHPTLAPRIWLGAPNSIKGPTEAVFQRQSGNHLLIVGQREEAILTMFSTALVSLAAQFPLGTARFILFDSTAPGSSEREVFERVVRALPQRVEVAKNNNIEEIISGVTQEMKARAGDERGAEKPPVFLFFYSLQRLNKLRYEEDFSFSSNDSETPNPAKQLNTIICEGSSLGIHVIASCDTYNNVNRFLGKKAFGEFEMRVLFQMSANDSASLIDNPKAGTLGLHRALFYNEQEGHLETFRPYALPGIDWIEEVATVFALP